MCVVDLIQNHKKIFFSVVVIGGLLASVAVPLFAPCSVFCSTAFANFGQWISGATAAVGIPFLIFTLHIQTQTIAADKNARADDEAEKKFDRLVRSIETGLGYIHNQANTVSGGSAIVRYGELCQSGGSIDFNTTTDELTVDALKGVVAALSELLDWVRQPSNRFKFHSFFRVRFMSLIIGFDRMLPGASRGMTEAQLFQTYGNDNERYALIKSIRSLVKKEFEVWAEYEEAKEQVERA